MDDEIFQVNICTVFPGVFNVVFNLENNSLQVQTNDKYFLTKLFL